MSDPLPKTDAFSPCLLGAPSPLVKECGSLRHPPHTSKGSHLRKFLLSRLSGEIWKKTLPKHQARFCSNTPKVEVKREGQPPSQYYPGVLRAEDGTEYRRRKLKIHAYDVEKGPDGQRTGYVGMSRCASPLICPVCSPYIRYKRKEEVVEAGRVMLKAGYCFIFPTFTAAHNTRASLYDFVLRFNAAYRDLKSGKRWQKFKKKWKLEHSIKAVETTTDKPDSVQKTGFHYHAHTIFFLQRPPLSEAEKKRFQAELRALWIWRLKLVGLRASKMHGCAVSVPWTKFNGDINDQESLERLAQYVSDAVGFEMTAMSTKKGKLDRRMSVWEHQKLALSSRPDLLPSYREYMEAMRGISFMRWSPGLKSFCGIPEKSDAELMLGIEEEEIFEFSEPEAEDFLGVASQGGQGKLLTIAEEEGPEGIRKALVAARNGIDIGTGEVFDPASLLEEPPEKQTEEQKKIVVVGSDQMEELSWPSM